MQLNLLRTMNRLPISQWLERNVLSLSFCPVSVNQTASCSSIAMADRKNQKGPDVFKRSAMFGTHILLDGKIDKNRVVSPLSFQVVPSLLAVGSGGSTRRQFLKCFNSDSVDRLNCFASQISDVIFADGDPSVGPRMRCSNGLRLDQSLTLNPSFKHILDSDNRAALDPVDFPTKAPRVRQHIDSWMENGTRGLVKDLVHEGSLNNSVQIIFKKALYLKVAWDEETCPRFRNLEDLKSENSVMAAFMTAKRKEIRRTNYSRKGVEMLDQEFNKKELGTRVLNCSPIMRLNLLHPRNRLAISQWLKRTVCSFSFCPVSVNQTASYSSITKADRTNQKRPDGFDKSEMFGNHLLADGEIEENRVVSPLSFQVVLSLLAAGSGGYTRRQLLKLFNSDSVDRLNYSASHISNVILADGGPAVGPCMRCSNALWLDQSLTLKPSFKHILDSDYRAALNPVDFPTEAPHARQQINSWVENETRGIVKDLVHEGSLNNSVKLVFTNALYFKGAWDREGCSPSPSLEDLKNEEDLSLSIEISEIKKSVMAAFMTAKRKVFGRWYDSFTSYNHPYKTQSEDKRAINMRFVYPITGDEDWRTAYGCETLMEVDGHMTPKFKICSEVEACDVLRQLRVTLPFSGGKLTEMLSCFDGRQLYVFKIFQKAFMEINEQGTEAGTATAAIVMSGCPPCLPNVPTINYVGFFPFLHYGGKDEHGCTINMAKTQLVVSQVFNPLPR